MERTPSPATAPKVLVIDDDPDTVYVYTHVLGGRGFVVDVCADGARAIEAARVGTPDVILMDFLLPGSDGWEATRALKSDVATAHIPVIGVGAYGDPHARRIALDAGCVAYFEKPVSPMVILEAVRKIVDARPAAPAPTCAS